MLIYSASIAIAFNLHLPRIEIGTALADRCPDPLIWQRFVADAAIWFILISVIMKLILTIDLNQHRKIGVSA